MKQLSILICATSIVLLQTGCLNRNDNAVLHDSSPASAEVAEPAVTKSIKSISTSPARSLSSNTAESVDVSPVDVSQLNISQAEVTTASVGELKPAQAVPNYVNISSFWVSTVDGQPLAMRSRGEIQAPVIATLAHNSSVIMRIGDPTGTWFEVATPEGKVGWVLGAFLVNFHTGARVAHLPAHLVAQASSNTSTNFASESVAQTSQEVTAFAQVVQTLDGEPLPMRVNPHLNSDLVKSLPDGTPLEILYNLGPWSHVRTEEGLEGFVATDYLVLRGQ